MDTQKILEEDYKQTTRKVNEELAECLEHIQYAEDKDEAIIRLVNTLERTCTIKFGNDIDRDYLIAAIRRGTSAADHIGEHGSDDDRRQTEEDSQ